MANQRGGLHKKVGSIFDGIPNPNEENTEAAQDNGAQFTSAPPKPPQQAFRPDSLGSETPKPVAKPAPAPLPEIVEPPKQADELHKKDRSVMLPASLTVKPGGMNLIDTFKVKWNEVIEKHGQRQVLMTMAIPVLAIGMIFAFYRVLVPSRPATVKIEPTVTTTVSASFDTGKVEFKWQKPEAYPTTELRDPMKTYRTPGTETQIQIGDITVNGILYDSDNPASSKAVINGQHVSIGDNVGAAKIIDIQEDYVEFELGEKIWKQSVGY